MYAYVLFRTYMVFPIHMTDVNRKNSFLSLMSHIARTLPHNIYLSSRRCLIKHACQLVIVCKTAFIVPTNE